MTRAKDVNPQKWKNKIVLFDNGSYSACWGYYDGGRNRVLGVRWNNGFPSQGGNPLWYVEPQFTTEVVLLALVKQLSGQKSSDDKEYLNNTLRALDEFNETEA